MQEITATLLASPHGGKQRVYQLSRSIKIGAKTTIKEALDSARERLKPKYQYLLEGASDEWDVLCISDAHTHIERLVFLGFYEDDEKCGMLSSSHIHGKMTMMIHGGNSHEVYSDAVYLRRLATMNGYRFRGITEKHQCKTS